VSAPQSNSHNAEIWKKGRTQDTDDNRRTEINIQRGIMEQVHDDEDLSWGGENVVEHISVVRPMA